MSRFTEEIDRLFEQLVHEVWRGTSLSPQRLPAESVLEFEVPTEGPGLEDVAFTTEGQQMIVTVRSHRSQALTGAQAAGTAAHFQQVVTLPVGTEVAGIEARFVRDTLRIRVTLRRRPASSESS